MAFDILDKRKLDALNKKNFRYPLAVAEKDYFLALVSKIVFDSPLRDKLVFKGGTAIHHCYLPQYRFSEDVDFTAIDKGISLDEVKTVLEAHDFFAVKKEYVSKATIKIERLLYSGPLGLTNSLKFEIDFLQNIVLPPRRLKYENVWGIETDVMVMDICEIFAEKIRACSHRVRYRDFYDLCLVFEHFPQDMDKIIGLVRQKEIRRPICKTSILENWRLAQRDKIQEISGIYYAREVSDDDIKGVIEKLDFDVIE